MTDTPARYRRLTGHDLAEARAGRARWVRDALSDLPRIAGPDYAASRQALSTATDALGSRLRDLPDAPRLRDDWNGASVTMLGIRASSTSGLHGALVNWCVRVERDGQATTIAQNDTGV